MQHWLLIKTPILSPKIGKNRRNCDHNTDCCFQSFSNQMARTSKRWQRRWFVLYDDGELTYSVDDHPETVPQVKHRIRFGQNGISLLQLQRFM
jgi:hypothetical protein